MKKLREVIRQQKIDHENLTVINNLTYDSPITHLTASGIVRIPKAVSEDVATLSEQIN